MDNKIKAIEKLNQEINSNKDNTYVKYVGDYLIGYIDNNPRHAENIIKEGKTIVGSLEHMRNKAKKKQKNNMAMLTPEEGFKIVLEYFEINETPALKVVNTQKKVDISLDELL
jgi:hypothetical protein